MLYLSLRYGPTAQNTITYVIICLAVFGTLVLTCLIWLLLRTEIIIVGNGSVTYLRFFTKTTIKFTEISEITLSKHLTYGMDGLMYESWQITDLSGRSIHIVQSKRRKRIIEFISSQAKNAIITIDG